MKKDMPSHEYTSDHFAVSRHSSVYVVLERSAASVEYPSLHV